MTLSSSYVLPINRIADVFAKIRDGQAPDQLTTQLLKDWGFSSSNDRAFLPLLKSLNFLAPNGQPTQRYHDYRDHSRSRRVMAEALNEAYRDLFLITSNPKDSDRDAIKGKFKSYHNASDNAAENMTKTFYALLKLADLPLDAKEPKGHKDTSKSETAPPPPTDRVSTKTLNTQLHYNIQVHLPATKDVEVYNAIFKSLREHFVE